MITAPPTKTLNDTQSPKAVPPLNQHRFCVAPMMDWTDRHCRYFHRQLSQQAFLYTEMITAPAIIHGDRNHLLSFDSIEHPIALQIGGSDPEAMAQCAPIIEQYGYDEININVGCPSDRVQKGRFGACLMAEPELVAQMVAAMKQTCKLPITVKTRIGIDHQDDYAFLQQFTETVATAGCDLFIIHARKAWLKGLSPKQNREKPPLHYERAYQLKQDFPDLTIIINGGINSTEDALQHLPAVDGVMLGRAAYQTPYLLSKVDSMLYDSKKACEHSDEDRRYQAVKSMMPYFEQLLRQEISLKRVTRHMSGLYHGEHDAKSWRRFLSETPTLTPNDILETAHHLAISRRERSRQLKEAKEI